eukprot:scaffold7011_cov112-Isochrysis_galbana.AAC.22
MGRFWCRGVRSPTYLVTVCRHRGLRHGLCTGGNGYLALAQENLVRGGDHGLKARAAQPIYVERRR